jgi:hypothetical protein
MLGNQTQLAVEDVGRVASVPNDPYMRLGYYLNSVACTSLPQEIPRRLADDLLLRPTAYHSNAELREILAWADGYSPEKMQRSGFFTLVSREVLNPAANKFLRISASSTEIGVLAGNSAAIALVRNSTASIELMLYQQSWANYNFYGPRQELLRIIEFREAEARRQAQAGQNQGGAAQADKQSQCCNVF